MFARTADRDGLSSVTGAITVLAVMALPLSVPVARAADSADDAGETLGEVVVTGSRLVVRDGYAAPVPLTVVGAEQVQQQATPNLIDYITTLPAFAGNYTPQNSTQNVSSGTAGTSSVNLRNLGTNRTLVLIDGQRSVPSTVQGLVDVNTIPQQLIERVEVVTGGASAAYGSDAVGGVVNFILDRKFTGFKAELSSGMTDYGDNESGKISMTGGTPFASGRGHFILSGQFATQDGVVEGDRPWNLEGWQIVTNPNYKVTNGVSNGEPQRILLNQISAGNATPGGIILFGRTGTSTANITGPLAGTAFGVGGAPYKFHYGALNGTNFAFTQGGDWETSSLHLVGQSIEPKISSKNIFARASFDVTDDINVFLQSNWYENSNQSHAYPNEFFGGLVVNVDNAFLPTAVRTQAQALGYTRLVMGTSNADMGTVTIDTDRKLVRNVVGAEGRFNLFSTDWKWNAYFQGGVSESVESAYHSLNLVKHALAIDAVVDPSSGAIVCRSTLTAPTNGCIPYNPFGINVNSQAALNYVLGHPRREQTFRQNVTAASVSGSPFEGWAGPIFAATGVEYREESVRGEVTAEDLAGQFFAGNYKPTFGKINVKEGFVETLVPLATDQVWAKALSFNAAARFTDYSTSGSVTTWKAGFTYKPIEDVLLRVIRSRDIRAPNVSELFNAGSRVNNLVIDNSTGLQYQYEGTTTGNPNLQPEEADTNSVGIVYQPSFLQGFSTSVDYWSIDLNDAINTISAQQIVDLCTVKGQPEFCQAINNGLPLGQSPRDAIRIQPFNLAEQKVRGIDLEASYRTALANIVSSMPGNLVFRALGTHFLENYTNNTLTLPTDTAGQNTGGGPADWRWNASLTYDVNPISGTFNARGVSSGTYGNAFIECTSGCPVSTTDHPTISTNHLPGAVYFDVSLKYSLMVGQGEGNGEETEVQAFLNVRNITNKDPVIVAGGPSGLPYDTVTTNPANYDSLGRTFLLGVRIKL
jgi:outer membrane receptor protein involved in Fe transport